MEQRTYDAVLFDFDYTLGDATEAIYAGFSHALTAMGYPRPELEAVRKTVGMLAVDAFTSLTGDGSPAGRDQFYELFSPVAREMQAQGRVRLFPGARELLAALKERGISTAVVSSKNVDTLRITLKNQGLEELLSVIVGDGVVSTHKPAPEGLLWALGQMGIPPERALYCGDTVIDAETARNGGTDFAAVLNGTTPAADFAPWPHVHIAPDLPELGRWLGL